MSIASPDIANGITTQQIDDGMRARMAGNLNEIGQKVEAEDLNPNDESPLETITRKLDEAGYVAGSKLDESFFGREPQTDIRVTPGRKMGRWVLDRARRMKGILRRK